MIGVVVTLVIVVIIIRFKIFLSCQIQQDITLNTTKIYNFYHCCCCLSSPKAIFPG